MPSSIRRLTTTCACLAFAGCTALQAEIAWGVNLAGAEYGESTTDVYLTNYIYPNAPGAVNSFKYYQGKNLRLIRLPIRWEHIQKSLWGALDANEVTRLKSCISDANAYGLKIIVDVHNYARYKVNGTKQVVGRDFDKSALGDLWKRLANELKGYSNLWAYDLMNEPWGMGPNDDDSATGQQLWFDVAQATINDIRTIDGSTRILVSGYQSSPAVNWVLYSDRLKNLTDSANNLVYQAHQYYDSDLSGTYSGGSNYDFQSQTGGDLDIGVKRMQPFIKWLRDNGKKGFYGESSIPGNNQSGWNEVFKRVLQQLKDNNDVVLGYTYWAGGPWWNGTQNDSAIQPLDDDNNPQDPSKWTDRPQMTVYLAATGGQTSYGGGSSGGTADQVTISSAPSSVSPGASSTIALNLSNVAASDRRLGCMFFSVANKGASNESWTYQTGDFPAVSGTTSRSVTLTIPSACPTGNGAWLAQIQNSAGTTTYGQASAYATIATASGDSSRYNFESSAQGWGNLWSSSQITAVATTTSKAAVGSGSLQISLSNSSGSTQYPAVLVQSPSGLSAGSVVTFRYFIPSTLNVTAVQPFTQTSNVNWTANWVASPTKGSWGTTTVTVPANPGTITNLGIQFAVATGVSGNVCIDAVTW